MPVKSPCLRLKILFCPIWLDTPTTAILGFWSRRRPTLCRLHKSCDLPNAAKRQRLVFVTFHTLNSSSSGAATLTISSGCQNKRQHASSGRMNWRSGGVVVTRRNQIFLPGGNVSNGANNLRFNGRRIASRTAGFPVVDWIVAITAVTSSSPSLNARLATVVDAGQTFSRSCLANTWACGLQCRGCFRRMAFGAALSSPSSTSQL